ncbi:hypothetical protein VP01_3791g2 [Puccinia sorghi]|uniref:CxC1-like cysteine cluster associated with KDZ transposases domain-containing protein n=1 Tax=Puccinia sorghi TaxID=27349 RepID=A0A0L6UVD2_9BASI|nr:hypothetical protein VP01_3791g2 [Puccinia sorghi]
MEQLLPLQERERISQQWSNLEIRATSTYLRCQSATQNWTLHTNNFQLPPNTCTCASRDIQTCQMDLLDMTGEPLHWPLSSILQKHAGPAQPQTAFPIHLIQYHHFLWHTAVISASSFVKAQLAFLNSCRKHLIFSDSGTFQRRNLNVTFSYSANLYSRILGFQNKMLAEGLKLSSSDQWASKCAQCFGPRCNKEKVHNKEPDIILATSPVITSTCPTSFNFIKPLEIATDAPNVQDTQISAQGVDIRLIYSCFTPLHH